MIEVSGAGSKSVPLTSDPDPWGPKTHGSDGSDPQHSLYTQVDSIDHFLGRRTKADPTRREAASLWMQRSGSGLSTPACSPACSCWTGPPAGPVGTSSSMVTHLQVCVLKGSVTSEKEGRSWVASTLGTWYGGALMGVLLSFDEAAILYRDFNIAPS